MRILCVCLGNTCRSPMAAAVLERLGGSRIAAESAGTRPRAAGAPASAGALRAAGTRGYDLGSHRARALVPDDFRRFDLILAADAPTLAAARAMRPAGMTTPLGLLLDYAPDAAERDIPDPYDTGDYDGALDQIEAAARGFLARILAADQPGAASPAPQ